jgi:hypothetical protein
MTQHIAMYTCGDHLITIYSIAIDVQFFMHNRNVDHIRCSFSQPMSPDATSHSWIYSHSHPPTVGQAVALYFNRCRFDIIETPW